MLSTRRAPSSSERSHAVHFIGKPCMQTRLPGRARCFIYHRHPPPPAVAHEARGWPHGVSPGPYMLTPPTVPQPTANVLLYVLLEQRRAQWPDRLLREAGHVSREACLIPWRVGQIANGRILLRQATFRRDREGQASIIPSRAPRLRFDDSLSRWDRGIRNHQGGLSSRVRYYM